MRIVDKQGAFNFLFCETMFCEASSPRSIIISPPAISFKNKIVSLNLCLFVVSNFFAQILNSNFDNL